MKTADTYPGKEYQELFDHMAKSHDLILTQTEMDDIKALVTSEQEIRKVDILSNGDVVFDGKVIGDASSYVEAQSKEIERLNDIVEKIKVQAQCWAGEAKSQGSTVKQVGSLLGGVPDWGPIVNEVESKLSQLHSQSALLKEAREALEKSVKLLKEVPLVTTMRSFPKDFPERVYDLEQTLSKLREQ